MGLLRRTSSSKRPLKEKVVLMYDDIFAVRTVVLMYDDIFAVRTKLREKVVLMYDDIFAVRKKLREKVVLMYDDIFVRTKLSMFHISFAKTSVLSALTNVVMRRIEQKSCTFHFM